MRCGMEMSFAVIFFSVMNFFTIIRYSMSIEYDAPFLKKIKNALEYVPQGVKSMLESAADAIISSLEKDCVYRCPNGSKPKINSFYVPESNGCGAGEFRIDERYIPFKKVVHCCDKHDICYGTCNKEMKKCDENFKECLHKLCPPLKELFGQNAYKSCKDIISAIYKTTSKIGCKYYKDAQKKACICPITTYRSDEL